MKKVGTKAPSWVALLASLWIAGCGGGGGGGNNNPPPPPKTTPTVTVTPGSQTISTTQSLTVAIAVTGTSGTPTGTVKLTSGTYSSAATTLTSGGASITIPAGSLAAGTVALSVAYTPDTASSSSYNSATGSASVSVTKASPTVTVTPASQSITTTQSLAVNISVNGGAGAPTTTGSVALTSGAYTSTATTLVSGSASITIPAGSLAAGPASLNATYTPDAASSAIYASASGTGSVTVSKTTPVVTVTPASQSITTAQSLNVSIVVRGGAGAPTSTGSVTLSSGAYVSSAATLTSGSASITIPANTLAAGTATLTAAYMPDSNSSSVYTSAQGTATVSVASPLAITSFTAAANPLVAGSSTTLTAVFTGGTGVITPGNISVTSGTPVTVNPTQTTPYTLTVTPTAGTAITQQLTLTVYPSVSVCTSPSCSGPPISANFLGTNLAMWYDDITNAPAILSAFNSAGITFVRWPGGSNSDQYHWATNSGCSGLYAAPSNTFANFESKIVQAGNLDLAVTANYGSNPTCDGGGDPSEAAAWANQAVAYGTPIHYMTVGNENYGSWEYDLHPIKHDPATYASAVTGTSGYYNLIKAQSPTTQVGVVVDANCTTANGCTNGWDSTVLANAKNYYDFVEYHFYPQNPGGESDTLLVRQAAQQFTDNIKTVKSELITAGAPDTPIFVGEIGSVSSNPGKQSWSITQGLYAGQILGEAMNEGITHLTWWIGFGNCNGDQGSLSTSLYGWQTFGAYNIFSDGPGDLAYPNTSPCSYGSPLGAMSPTAQAFNLFQNVAVKGEYPQTATVVDGTGYTLAYAATHSGGYALVLFNLNQTAAQTVSVSIGAVTSSSDVKLITYDKQIYDYTDTNCQADQPACSYDPNHNYSTVVWAPPATTDLGPQTQMPLTLTLQPWSMNVVIVQK